MCGIIVRPSATIGNDNSITYRGPDVTVTKTAADYKFIFHRLAIMDISHSGDQPFENDSFVVVCNGEIFNHKQLRRDSQYPYISHSDCEVLLPLLAQHAIAEVCQILDGEFAFVAYDKGQHKLIAARDPMGIRPLFYGYCENGQIAFASEMKALLECCAKTLPFPPGHYYDGVNIK